jgi:hypothetical protein
LTPGKPVKIILDPWGVEIESKGPVYDGGYDLGGSSGGGGSPYRAAPRRASNPTEEIKVWGRRRLFSLARVLPLTDRIEVRLLGSGLPSVWIAHMGDMRLVLALSGWTTNDWASGVGLDLLAGSRQPDIRTMGLVDQFLQKEQRANLAGIASATGLSQENLVPALHRLAKQGQLIFDHADEVYRYRQVMSDVLGEAMLGPEHPELVEGRKISQTRGGVVITRDEMLPDARRAVVAKSDGTNCEAIFDADLVIKKAKCSCSFFHKSGLRAGPCRHLLALRMVAEGRTTPEPAAAPVVTPDPPKGASRWSSGEPFRMPKPIVEEIRKAAARKNTTVSRIIEEAWDIGMPRIQATRSWTSALALADASMAKLLSTRTVTDTTEERLALPPDVIAELGRLATRFRADRSAVIALAWLIARKSV